MDAQIKARICKVLQENLQHASARAANLLA